jgi:hypothetical protein
LVPSKAKQLNILRVFLLGTLLLSVAALVQYGAQIYPGSISMIAVRTRMAFGLGVVGVLFQLAVLAFALTARAGVILDRLTTLGEWLRGSKTRSAALLVLAVAGYNVLVLGYLGRYFTNVFPRLALFWALVAFSAACARAWWREKSWLEMLLPSVMACAVVYQLATLFTQVSDFPFSLGWSEVSRYYNASLFFGPRVYGRSLPWTITHPSRYVLQGIPFLVTGFPLWFHRLWQVLLWLGITGACGWALARRMKPSTRFAGWLIAAWVFLYLMQGVVYYHLLVCVTIVLLGYDRRRFWRSMVVVALASIWAGISRINWVPMPGMIAASLYFLERPVGQRVKLIPWRYLIAPVAHFLMGSLVALVSYYAYISLSGNQDAGQFGSAFTSDLLWDRLLPNVSYSPGILLGIARVSAPLAFLLFHHLLTVRGDWHPIRLLGLGSFLVVLFGGGLVVSVKIGGGTNLHNMDAYMVILMMVGMWVYFGRHAREPAAGEERRKKQPWWLTAGLVLVPALLIVLQGRPVEPRDHETAKKMLEVLTKIVYQANDRGEEVLFISQRHLLTFHFLEDVPLVHEYEKIFLMEMAIARNRLYLDDFERDMHQQRFGLIISDPLNLVIRRVGVDNLAEENNFWVQGVSEPLLSFYRPRMTFEDIGVQVLSPKPLPGRK